MASVAIVRLTSPEGYRSSQVRHPLVFAPQPKWRFGSWERKPYFHTVSKLLYPSALAVDQAGAEETFLDHLQNLLKGNVFMSSKYLRFFVVLTVLALSFWGTAPCQASRPPATSLPTITLTPGEFYFRVDGKPAFIFSRNLAGYYQSDYPILLDWSEAAGTQVARVGLDSIVMGGYGYTNQGVLKEEWARTWEWFFDKAEARGIYILPFFGGWFNWNTMGVNSWATNPLNAANGGPAQDPLDVFEGGSLTQELYFQWMASVIARWQDRSNILAWELYSEVNYTQGLTEEAGVAFIERAAAIARAADAHHRPLTASLADMGEWPSFYRSDAVEFINFHPYPTSGKLDSYTLQEVRRYRATYHKPVLIGESGLNAALPDTLEGRPTVTENAHLGLEHAIWAELVAGSMNGRAFWWEDGHGIYFPELSWPFLKQYDDTELPASRFVQGIDFSHFEPLESQFSAYITGAAIGTESMIIGWYRDAGCEPLEWNLQPVISGQSVTITVPGAAAGWKVDFYDTKTGTDILGSVEVSQQGSSVTVSLPDFHDDIAFKMVSLSNPSTTTVPPSAAGSTDAIAGDWMGMIISDTGDFSTQILLSIQPGCSIGSICGTISTPQLPCSGTLLLAAIHGDVFTFTEQDMTGAAFCVSGGQEFLQLQAGGNLSYRYEFVPDQGAVISSSGILIRP